MKAKGDYGSSPLRSDSSPEAEAEPYEQWPKATYGGPSDLSPLRSDGSPDGQTGRLDWDRWPKTLKEKQISSFRQPE
jgi:hypothetical protein